MSVPLERYRARRGDAERVVVVSGDFARVVGGGGEPIRWWPTLRDELEAGGWTLERLEPRAPDA